MNPTIVINSELTGENIHCKKYYFIRDVVMFSPSSLRIPEVAQVSRTG